MTDQPGPARAPSLEDLARAPLSAAAALGSAARAMALDAVSGAFTAAETARDAFAGRTTALATLSVRVLILSDEAGRPLLQPERLAGALAAADRILTAGAGVRVRAEAVETAPEPAPTALLDPRANRGLLLDHLLGRTAFLQPYLPRRGLLAVGDPVTVVVVRRIAGNVTGCSLGMTADWVLAQAALFDEANPRGYDETVLAHELGHALNLPHVRNRTNLMTPMSTPPGDLRGTELARWQRAIVRANRHVVPPTPSPRRRAPGAAGR